MLSAPTAHITLPMLQTATAVVDIVVLGVVAVRVAGFVLQGDEPAG